MMDKPKKNCAMFWSWDCIGLKIWDQSKSRVILSNTSDTDKHPETLISYAHSVQLRIHWVSQSKIFISARTYRTETPDRVKTSHFLYRNTSDPRPCKNFCTAWPQTPLTEISSRWMALSEDIIAAGILFLSLWFCRDSSSQDSVPFCIITWSTVVKALPVASIHKFKVIWIKQTHDHDHDHYMNWSFGDSKIPWSGYPPQIKEFLKVLTIY